MMCKNIFKREKKEKTNHVHFTQPHHSSGMMKMNIKHFHNMNECPFI